MTAEEYADHLFGIATGWLGWPPDVAMITPIPRIHIAMKARAKWVAMCNGQPDESPADRIKRQLRAMKGSRGN